MASEESLEGFRHRLYGAVISTYAAFMVLVPLKLWCRIRAGGIANLGLDDALTVLAFGLANAFTWICLIGMHPALGIHVVKLGSPTDLIEFLKYVFAAQLIYTFVIASIKFSILAFYWRIFSVTMRIPIYIVSFIVFGWLMGIVFAVIFACDPVRASWDITIPDAKCVKLKSIYMGGSIPNVITDAVLIVMPIPYVWRLHAPVSQRLILAGMFMLGIFIAVVSVVRLFIFLHIPISQAMDVTFHFREVIIWSCVEINVGLACACLPSLRPVLGFLGLKKLFPSSNSNRPDAKSSDPSKNSRSWMSRSGGSSQPSRPRKRGATGGLFSTLARTRVEEEDDAFQLMDKPVPLTESNVHGSSNARISLPKPGEDLESGSRKKQIPNGISVERNWSVFVDDKVHNHG